jgi:hypothetical protein
MQPNKFTGFTTAVAICAILLLAIGLFPAISTQLAHGASSNVEEAITYQGRLTDPSGNALDGNYSMQFLLYANESGGASIWDSGALSVAVQEGLFKVDLNVNQSDFDGRSLWLEIVVGGQILAPRQAIRPAPLALGLRPGASIVASEPGSHAFSVQHVATGTAVRVEAPDLALYGSGGNFGVYGQQSGSSLGYGGYFTSTHGAGVFGGTSGGAISVQNPNIPGVWGQSQHGIGVLGEGSSLGVRGSAATGFGVHGGTSSGGGGVLGTGADFGIYGSTAGSTQARGYAGYFTTNTGVGVFGRSTAQLTANNLFAPGVWGYSQHGTAIYGEAGQSNVAGYFRGNLIVDGNITATGSKAGYVLDIALNDGVESLETGDVVVITGVAEPVIGNIPVPTVRKATSRASTGVIGVVDRRYVTNVNGYGEMVDGSVADGEYVGIVTLGAFEAIRVDASYGAIQPGDLMVSSPTPGHAMLADNPGVGTVIGKALAGLEDGTGTVPVLVTLQ